MTRPAPRSHFHSARLVRVLAGLGLADASRPGAAFAEKLGHWVGIKQAIALRAAHGPVAAAPAATTNTSADSVALLAGLDQAIGRMRTHIEQAITHGTSGKGSRAHLDLPAPKPGQPIELAGAFEPYRRHYQAHQREMELALRPLRARVLEALGGASPALRQLAALDTALESVLNERQTQLLAAMPTRLERRFKQLRAAHQQGLQDGQADRVEDWTRPGGWLARFSQELQSLLLAEWDLRLQPTLGLLEALHHDTPPTP